MFSQQGIPAMAGIAIQKAYVLQQDVEYTIYRHYIKEEEVQPEIERVYKAIEKSVEEIDKEIESLEEHSGIGARILDFHKALLLSPDLKEEIKLFINEQKLSAEYSVYCVIHKWTDHFAKLEDKRATEKSADFLDVERKLMRHLGVGKFRELQDIESETVIIAHNLTPSQTAALFHSKVKGFATDIGGNTSHTAIMARSLMIPAVVGTGNLSTRLKGGETVIIDGMLGIVIVDPDEKTLKKYQEAEQRYRKAFGALMLERDFPAETLDGYEVEIMANIELAEEVDLAVKMGAMGIGLYRTEFLYEQHFEPSEEIQVMAYEEVLSKMHDKPCVIRTMDLGADKMSLNEEGFKEPNPFLGQRSIRYSLAHPESFITQLRAILKASVKGQLQLMFPMISSVDEIREAKKYFEKVKESLVEEGIEFADHLQVGIMVEVPSAALMVDELAKEVDFFSIGTNDLIQYTMAVDRVNERVAHLYQPGSPAVLRLLQRIIKVGRKNNIKISLCGEMSADPRFAFLLLGLGLRSFSVAPVVIPTIKHLVRSVSLNEAEAVAKKILTLPTTKECNEFLKDRVKSLLPNIV